MKIVKDEIGGYRVEGTSIIIARQNECKCCWYVLDQDTTETIQSAVRYFKYAKQIAANYLRENG